MRPNVHQKYTSVASFGKVKTQVLIKDTNFDEFTKPQPMNLRPLVVFDQFPVFAPDSLCSLRKSQFVKIESASSLEQHEDGKTTNRKAFKTHEINWNQIWMEHIRFLANKKVVLPCLQLVQKDAESIFTYS